MNSQQQQQQAQAYQAKNRTGGGPVHIQPSAQPTHKKANSISSTGPISQMGTGTAQGKRPSGGGIAQYQNLSQSSTPKGGKKVQIIGGGGPQSQQQQYIIQQAQQQPRVMVTAAQQQQMLFDNRKRSTETQFYQQQVYQMQQQMQHQAAINHSKSTKASPTRVQTASQPGSSHKLASNGPPIQAKLANGQQAFDGVRQQQMNSMDHHNQYQGPVDMNTLQFYNFDMEGIPQQLVSQTQVQSKQLAGPAFQKQKDMVLLGASGGQQVYHGGSQSIPMHQGEDMDSSMHQSFINLIYPSKSKKLMSNESSQQVTSKDNLVTTSSGGQVAVHTAGPQHQQQLTAGSIHHQKSKSLYVGGSQNHIVQNLVKPVVHQIPSKGGNNPSGGVQKIQQSSYKKQQNIFNYSQRFKELLNETMGGEDPGLHSHKHGGGSMHQQLFSHQHSPTGSGPPGHSYTQGNNIMVNYGEINAQRASQPSAAHLKSTFDKPLVSQSHQQQYLSISDQAMLVAQGNSNMIRQEINKTIDYTQPTSQYGNVKNGGSVLHNTPNTMAPGTNSKGMSGGGIVMSSKSKIIQDQKQGSLLMHGAQGSLHQRKPSHPVTNNFMLELLQGPPPQVNNQFYHNPLAQSFVATSHQLNHHQIDLSQSTTTGIQQQSRASGISATIDHSQQRDHRQLVQYQQLQPVREKKQHQPTQSKIIQNKQPNGHQRSASDYLQQQNQNFLQNENQQLMRFLNSESYDLQQVAAAASRHLQEELIESFEKNLDNTTVTHSGQVNLGVTTPLDSGRILVQTGTNQFIQNAFSQMLYDGGSSGQQIGSHRGSYPVVGGQPILDNKVGGIPNNLLSAVQSSSTIYHHRKMSLQQAPNSSSSQHTLNVKKSPQKNQQQQQQQKIIVGGASIDQQQYQKLQQKRKSSPTAASSNYINASTKATAGGPAQKGVQMLIKTSSLHQQSQGISSSMRSSQVSSPNHHKQSKVVVPVTHHHSSSTTQFSGQQPIIIGGGQQIPQTAGGHNRSNSDLMKQQIMAAQIAAMKKQQMNNNRPNPAINTAQQQVSSSQHKAKSELTTPRQKQSTTGGHQKKISQGVTPANVSIDLVKQQQPPHTAGQTQRGALSKNGSSHNIARKDSHTPRLKQQTPPTSKQGPSQQNSSTQGKNFQGAVKRYSVQNSPRANNVIQQQQKVIGAGGNSQSQYNLSQQYQMFQQVMAKQQHQQQKFNQNVKPSAQDGTVSPKMMILNNPRTSIQGKSSVEEVPEGVKQHQRGVSETEFLLNQIRNNINTLKGYQQNAVDSAYVAAPSQHKGAGLQKITEASGEQHQMLQEAYSERLLKPKPTQPANKRGNLQLLEVDSNSYQPLPTDPNMSPYSKDLNKLQKMIKFNFRKFNEAPATTSEFYRIGRVLGRGAFGKVNLAAHKLSEQLVAIKSINKEFLRSSKHNKNNEQEKQVPLAADVMVEHPEKKKVMQEFAILKQSNHSSVVRLYDTFETNKHICFVMELCAGGDLLTYVRKRRKLTEEVAKYFFKQLIEGLAYLHHSKLIVHRDIKLDNILLDANGKIKIADFGVSRQVQTESERMTEQCGTPAYIAPEILKDKGYEGFKVDVWSAGVCLYAMLIGTVPFKAASMQELHHLIINGKYDINNPNANCQKEGAASTQAQQQQQQTKLSEHAVNLIQSLLQVDPRRRLSAVEVLSHPWLKDAKYDGLDVFTQKEKDVIHKEYLAKNIDRTSSSTQAKQAAKEQQLLMMGTAGQLNLAQIHQLHEDTEVIFTEHNLDTRTNVGDLLLKNASTKSIILAPFNSTVSEIMGDDGQPLQYVWPESVKRMILPKRVLRFAPKVKDLDRQYEHNNNADLDNGVYNNIGNEDDPAAKQDSDQSRSSESNDSLKRSFKETELSSDDERAEQQIEEARNKQKMQQQSELQEFEKQIKLKYVRYQEPQEVIDVELVNNIASSGGVYPRDYLLKVLQAKDMNYATATYHLLLKKEQQLAKAVAQLSLM